jgi:hypothetical protein
MQEAYVTQFILPSAVFRRKKCWSGGYSKGPYIHFGVSLEYWMNKYEYQKYQRHSYCNVVKVEKGDMVRDSPHIFIIHKEQF